MFDDLQGSVYSIALQLSSAELFAHRVVKILDYFITYILIYILKIFQNIKLLLPHKSKIINFVSCYALMADS